MQYKTLYIHSTGSVPVTYGNEHGKCIQTAAPVSEPYHIKALMSIRLRYNSYCLRLRIAPSDVPSYNTNSLSHCAGFGFVDLLARANYTLFLITRPFTVTTAHRATASRDTVARSPQYRYPSRIPRATRLHAHLSTIKQPILMVHGAHCSAACFKSTLPLLARAGFASYALSFRGHRNSWQPSTFSFYALTSIDSLLAECAPHYQPEGAF